MDPDLLYQKLANITHRCEMFAARFGSFKNRAKKLSGEASNLLSGGAFADDGDGFTISYPWLTVRFSWEPVGKDREVYGLLVVECTSSAADADAWRRVVAVPYSLIGLLDDAIVSPDAKGLTIGDDRDDYYLLMHMLIDAHMTPRE